MLKHKEQLSTHLIINGFTLNPVKDQIVFNQLIISLCSIYEKKHVCDHVREYHNEKYVIHENYLGKLIGTPSISYIQNENFQGLIRFCSY